MHKTSPTTQNRADRAMHFFEPLLCTFYLTNTNFRLGNERDMQFANRFFDIDELAYMQIGFPWFADFRRYEKEADKTCIRKGFVEEMTRDYVEAIQYYNEVSDKKLISERLEYAQERNDEEAENFYREAWKLINEGKYNNSNVIYNLMRAADMGYKALSSPIVLLFYSEKRELL